MNEQLVVKNFGPIKDATVDFKRVTVFIGPTGGGKSTLAKLYMMFSGGHAKLEENGWNTDAFFLKHRIEKFSSVSTDIKWRNNDGTLTTTSGNIIVRDSLRKAGTNFKVATESEYSPFGMQAGQEYQLDDIVKNFISHDSRFKSLDKLSEEESIRMKAELSEAFKKILMDVMTEATKKSLTAYIPAERVFIPAIEYSWAGLLRDDIGLPKDTLDFANSFSIFRKDVPELDIPFLNVKYLHINGRDFIKIPDHEELLMLLETASGIQSVTPLLVLLEHLSRNAEQAQSFIIEEPELNLYPTAQQGLLNWLVEKCTKGENDLTITTHSPYLLAHFNLLLYAYQVAENHPDRAEDVAKIVPRESWINPKEFAAYHVEGQQENGVRSIVNPETGLISYNGLDSTASAETAEFEKLLDINAGLEVE